MFSFFKKKSPSPAALAPDRQHRHRPYGRAALAYRLKPFAFGTDPMCRCGAPAAQGRRECWPCTDSRRAERLARRRATYARNKEQQ